MWSPGARLLDQISDGEVYSIQLSVGKGPSRQIRQVMRLSHRPEIRNKWIAVLEHKATNWNPDYAGICELHFNPQAFLLVTYRKAKCQRKILKTTAIPSVFNCYPEGNAGQRQQKKKKKTFMQEESQPKSTKVLKLTGQSLKLAPIMRASRWTIPERRKMPSSSFLYQDG
ncbi:hypothetical protein E2C01_005354 [Portunus trituberculatus]|uniref:THAP-type domain-containing protein n=1 Tax=Portunus trituberculatus TaxID=210409 RepID=A0A5B7CTB2_PORTR|nr:hypothetical protein [Portunus trituberculatus]